MKPRLQKVLKTILILAAILLLVGIAYNSIILPWQLRWGATDAEVAATLPGDEYIPNPDGPVTNRAITIHASAAEIWPWLVQIGADKGGLYSYEWIEAMINCPITNADRIHPEWQNLAPGDPVKLCPGDFGPPAYTVIELIPERAMIIGHPPQTEVERLSGIAWVDTWALVLEPVDENTTRLIMRTRNAIRLSWIDWIEPGVFIMQRGMLRGIRQRAESSP
jgi:hypothetical protein